MQDELIHMLVGHDKDVKKQMAEQSRKHAAELAALKQSQMATHNLVTHKATPQVHSYKVSAHLKSMTKASEMLLMENQTIGQHSRIISFKKRETRPLQ
jgi:hypothetical protein